MANQVKIKLPVTDPSNPPEPPVDDTSIQSGGVDEPKIVNIDGSDYTLDQAGNAINSEGKVVKTKEELENVDSDTSGDTGDDKSKDDKTGDDTVGDSTDDLEVVVIDEKEYKLDKEGNAINEDGSIFMDKDKLKELEEVGSDDEKTLNIEEIEKFSGIELLDKDGKKIIYDNSIEGIAKREADIKQHFLEQGKQESLNQFLEQNPDIYKMINYKDRHGTLEGYKEDVDYSKITLDKENEQQLSDVIIEAEIKKGNNIDRAKRTLNYIKSDGRLFEEAQESQQFLLERQNAETTQQRQREQEAINRQIREAEEHYGFRYNNKGEIEPLNVENSVYDVIVNKGQIEDLIIPTDGIKVKTGDGKLKHYSRKDVLNYISTVVDGGLSQAQIDERSRLTNKSKLLKQYIYNLTGGDISSFVKAQDNKNKVNKIKARFKTKESGKQTGNVSTDKRVKLPVN